MTRQAITAPESLTVHCVREFSQAWIEAACSHEGLCLDLSTVSHIDTAGIQLLLVLRREASQARKDLTFEHPSHAVRGLVDFYQLGDLFGNPATAISA
jgi:anti-sigma B factor antagonist